MNDASRVSAHSHRRTWTGPFRLIVLLTVLLLPSCMSWYSVPFGGGMLRGEELVGKTVRVATSTGITELVVQSLAYPMLEGQYNGMFMAINLENVTSMQVKGFDAGETFGGVLGGIAGAFLAVATVGLVVLVAVWE